MSYITVIKETIYPELEKGRPGWDKPHTEAVVYYIKQIMQHSELDLDKDVLLIAAYAHDWGYSGLFENNQFLSIGDVAEAKPAHMKIGSEKIGELLKQEVFSHLSNQQKDRIVHLVRVHDQLDKINDSDEHVLVEADTLGGLDVDRIKPTYDKESNRRYMVEVKSKRYPLFITDYGKEKFSELFQARKRYYEDNGDK